MVTKKLNLLFVSIIWILLLLVSCDLSDKKRSNENQELGPLFTLLSSKETNVSFINILDEGDYINPFYYINVFNGGGVAAGDINNDGLLDLYFTGNQVSNKLYLNKGNFVFEDITESAGVGGNNGWCTGVTMVDINNDGYLDIYVCRSFSDDDPGLRENLLYINNGDKTFHEAANQYGINDSSYAVQAVFFDYDLDSDLDLFIGNHPREFPMDKPVRFEKRLNPPHFESDKLYRNNGNNSFTDVTAEAGILNHGYTLGVMCSDLDDDNWPDIYVAVDHGEPDNYYRNNGDGTFTNIVDGALKHMSNFGMGVDLADFNNDKLLDIIVVDMMALDNYRQKTQMSGMNPKDFWLLANTGYHYQYMRNTLQINNGNGTFSEIGQLANIHYTDWSWAPLMIDFNNDGYKDLFITNGYRKDFRDNDFRIAHEKLEDDAIKSGETLHADILLNMMSSTKLVNYYFENNRDLTFTDRSEEYGFNFPSFSSGATYGDLDNDGDLDLVVNNLNDNAMIYRNNCMEMQLGNYIRFKLEGYKQNVMGLGCKIILDYNGQYQYQELTLTRGFQSSVEPTIHFGLGNMKLIEKVTVVWPNGAREVLKDVAANQLITLYQKNATHAEIKLQPSNNSALFTEITDEVGINFVHKENEYDDFEKEILLPHKMSQFGPGLATGDVNGDGLEDFYIGGALGQVGSLFIQTITGKFTQLSDQDWVLDKASEDLGALLFDADNDHDLDLYVVSGGNEFAEASPLLQDRLYLNDGSGKFTKSNDRLPQLHTSGSCVVPGDYDGDGDLDLFVGGRVVPGKYPFAAKSYILRNDQGVFTDVTAHVAPGLVQPGMVTSAIWTDFDNDQDIDLIVVGEWMPVCMYRNTAGFLEDVTMEYDMENTTGWWNRIIGADFDNDGDIDYVVGNLGLNYKYKASVDIPFKIYCNDFEDNGTLDIVLSWNVDGTYYPVRGRSCSSQQMPYLKKKFPTYNDFANANLEQIYGEKLQSGLHYEAMEFGSCYIENLGNEQFLLKLLPVEAQFSVVNGLLSDDYDKDGHLDILIAGNLYVSEVETGRADAGIGCYLKGDGEGNFSSVPVTQSGFFVEKDVKELAVLQTSDARKLILVANNDDRLQILTYK